jgi:hypothetical protein
MAWEGPERAAHGGGRRRRRRRSWEAMFQWELGGNRGSSSASKQRESLHKDGLGRRRSGVGCPRACRAWPERKRTAAEGCGSDARNWALGVAEQDVGVEVVLLRVRDRELRRGGGLSTATRRWRPAEARGRRGARARGQEGRGTPAGKARGDTWARAETGGGARSPVPAVSGGGRAEQRGSGGARGRRSREVSGGLVCNSQKVQGPLCKPKFLTATKVK